MQLPRNRAGKILVAASVSHLITRMDFMKLHVNSNRIHEMKELEFHKGKGPNLARLILVRRVAEKRTHIFSTYTHTGGPESQYTERNC